VFGAEGGRAPVAGAVLAGKSVPLHLAEPPVVGDARDAPEAVALVVPAILVVGEVQPRPVLLEVLGGVHAVPHARRDVLADKPQLGGVVPHVLA